MSSLKTWGFLSSYISLVWKILALQHSLLLLCLIQLKLAEAPLAEHNIVIILKGIRKLTQHWSQWNWWWWQFLVDLIFSPEQMPRVGAGPIGWTALPFLKQTCFEISKSQSHQTNVWHLQIHHWGQATQAPFIFLQSYVEMSLLNPSSNAFCSETWYIMSVRKEKWGSAFWQLAPTMVTLDSDFLGAVKPHFLM